jgi:hypothetical protein
MLHGSTTQYLFPRILYGTTRETRAVWAKISRRLAKTGDWESALADVELVDVSSFPGEIMIRRAVYGATRNAEANHWRLYHCINFESLYKPKSGEDIDVDLHARVIVNGVRQLWFALAMLEASGGDLPIDHQMKDRDLATNFVKLVADALVGQLDSIVALSSRFSSGGFEPEVEALNFGRCWWIGGVVGFVCQATNRVPTIQDWWKEIDRDFDGDCIRWLLAKGLIERSGGEFHVLYSQA